MESVSQSLHDMRCIDVRTVEPATLREIEDVKINSDLSKMERIQNYIDGNIKIGLNQASLCSKDGSGLSYFL